MDDQEYGVSYEQKSHTNYYISYHVLPINVNHVFFRQLRREVRARYETVINRMSSVVLESAIKRVLTFRGSPCGRCGNGILHGVTTVCQHNYHCRCLGEWLATADTCPLCDRVLRIVVADALDAVDEQKPREEWAVQSEMISGREFGVITFLNNLLDENEEHIV